MWSVRYSAYGNVVREEVAEVRTPIRFQGQYFDEETGLHYNRFRYYHPGVGQFVNQDPIGLLGGINNYLYAPNPLLWIDPFGLSCKESKYSKLKEMDPYFDGENKPGSKAWGMFGAQVRYLSDEEKTAYEIFERDGLLVDKNGVPIDSGSESNGKFMFVMDPQGRVYAGSHKLMEFHHSSFLAGKPVSAAGELELIDGKVVGHSRSSGHYKPSPEHHGQFLSEMAERGVDMQYAQEYSIDEGF